MYILCIARRIDQCILIMVSTIQDRDITHPMEYQKYFQEMIRLVLVIVTGGGGGGGGGDVCMGGDISLMSLTNLLVVI